MQNGEFQNRRANRAPLRTWFPLPSGALLDRTFRFTVNIVKLGVELIGLVGVGRVLAARFCGAGTGHRHRSKKRRAARARRTL